VVLAKADEINADIVGQGGFINNITNDLCV
jgi:hypothetical protein